MRCVCGTTATLVCKGEDTELCSEATTIPLPPPPSPHLLTTSPAFPPQSHAKHTLINQQQQQTKAHIQAALTMICSTVSGNRAIQRKYASDVTTGRGPKWTMHSREDPTGAAPVGRA